LPRLGYHPATYVRQEVAAGDAFADIAATGWDGFEWSPAGLAPYYDDPGDFKAHLAGLDVEVSGIYCSCGFRHEEEIRQWQERIDATITFASEIGTRFILIDGGSAELPRDFASIEKVAGLANDVGQRIHAAGLKCTWHQHWGTLFQYPAEFHALMAATDPERVGCTLDTAQLALGGFDVPATFERYLGRMRYVHLKDLDDDRRFIELGRGRVDFPRLARMLVDANFDAWIVVDLDYTSLTPAESSRMNLRYLQSTLGLSGRRGQSC